MLYGQVSLVYASVHKPLSTRLWSLERPLRAKRDTVPVVIPI